MEDVITVYAWEELGGDILVRAVRHGSTSYVFSLQRDGAEAFLDEASPLLPEHRARD